MQPWLEGSSMLRCTASRKMMSQQSRGSGRRSITPTPVHKLSCRGLTPSLSSVERPQDRLRPEKGGFNDSGDPNQILYPKLFLPGTLIPKPQDSLMTPCRIRFNHSHCLHSPPHTTPPRPQASSPALEPEPSHLSLPLAWKEVGCRGNRNRNAERLVGIS